MEDCEVITEVWCPEDLVAVCKKGTKFEGNAGIRKCYHVLFYNYMLIIAVFLSRLGANQSWGMAKKLLVGNYHWEKKTT